jgi:hypothetical protein
MTRPARSVSLVSVLALAAVALAVPAAAGPGDRSPGGIRVVSQAVVHGRTAAGSQVRPTSFDVLASRSRAKGSAVTRPSPTAPRAPQAVLGFEALTDPVSFPADPTGALGETYFVAAVNTQVAIYDRTGVEVLAPIQLADLHPDTVDHLAFDPKVVYDQYSDTFVVVYLVQEDTPRRSNIVAITIPDDTATNPSTWCRTLFPGDLVPESPQVWADYPGLGYDIDRLTITTNQFSFPSASGQFRYAQVLSIPKASLYDCSTPDPVVPDVFAGTQTQDSNGVQAFTIQPAQTVDLPGSAQLLASVEVVGRNSYAVLWRIATSAAGTLQLKRAIVPIGRAGPPPFGTQGGGSLTRSDTFWDTGDQRLINAFYDADDNQLFAAHAVARDFGPDIGGDPYVESAVRWYEFEPAPRLRDSSLARKGNIGAPEVDVGWPSVATDGSGNLFVTYSRASAVTGEFLSAWVAEIPPGSTSARQVLLTAGVATYDQIPGVERWGDFTAINRDPIDPSILATFSQYASSATSWQQVVNTVRHA